MPLLFFDSMEPGEWGAGSTDLEGWDDKSPNHHIDSNLAPRGLYTLEALPDGCAKVTRQHDGQMEEQIVEPGDTAFGFWTWDGSE